MRWRLPSTRLLRSDPAKRRSTTSGPGRCRCSFGILGLLKLSRYSALSPRYWAIVVIVFFVLLECQSVARARTRAPFPAARRRPQRRRIDSTRRASGAPLPIRARRIGGLNYSFPAQNRASVVVADQRRTQEVIMRSQDGLHCEANCPLCRARHKGYFL